jgi:HK97 family phage prohead protease
MSSEIEKALERLIERQVVRVPAVGEIRHATFTPEIRATDEESRTIEFVASNERVDRYGDIIRVAGWKTADYMRNPVVLWSHRSSDPPVGKTTSLKMETNPPALVQRVQFATKATYPFADTVFQLYKNNFLKSVSVGFKPLEQPKAIRDTETDQITGFEFTSQDLLELSCVPLPANPDAVARAVEAGIVTSKDADHFFKAAEPVADEKLLRDILRRVIALEAQMARSHGSSSLEELLALDKEQSIETLAELESALKGT